MNSEQIHLTDLKRILMGEAPPAFFIELLIRVVFVYVLLQVSMRLMGKRMAAQLSRTEMVALVSLAAAIGIPIQSPDRGLVPALAVAVVVVVAQRLVARFTAKSGRIERLAQGDMNELISDGVLRLDEMKFTRITRERLFAQVRSSGVTHLGKVKRVYLEANGDFTTVMDPKPKPGLSVIPDFDQAFVREQHVARGVWVCSRCGARKLKTGEATCPACGCDQFVEALE